MPRITVLKKVLASNDALAEAQRQQLDAAGIIGINIMSAPGSGKTSLVERTVAALKSRYRIHVIEGDIHGDLDARRIMAQGVSCTQINTQGDCHIDSLMLASVFPQLDLAQLDLLIIENVGNLVCPAEFRLPAHYNVMILSTPEGSDKPAKYPLMFTRSDLLIINKIDLLPFVDFDFQQLSRAVRRINPKLPVLRLSTKTGEGVADWLNWLTARIAASSQR